MKTDESIDPKKVERLAAFFCIVNARSAVQEIEAAIALLTFIVALAGSAIISELRRLG